jgi:hypothetical protein
MSDLFSSLLIFTIMKAILSTFSVPEMRASKILESLAQMA